MGTAVAERNAESLGVAHDDVGTPLSWRRQQHLAEQVGGDGYERIVRVSVVTDRRIVADGPVRGRVLYECAEHLWTELELVIRKDVYREAASRCAGLDHADGLRMAVVRNEEYLLPSLAGEGMGEPHRLGSRGGLIEQRGVGNGESGQVSHHGLEVQQGFQAPLGNFGLIWRVGSVPGWAFYDVALDDRRSDAVREAHADVRPVELVAGGDASEQRQRFRFGPGRRDRELAPEPDSLWNGRIYQGVEAVVAECGEHLGYFGRRRADVAGCKLISAFERGGSLNGSHLSRDWIVRRRRHWAPRRALCESAFSP